MLGNAWAAANQARHTIQKEQSRAKGKGRNKTASKIPTIFEDEVISVKLSPRSSRKKYGGGIQPSLSSPDSSQRSPIVSPNGSECGGSRGSRNDELTATDAKSLFSVYVEKEGDNVSLLTDDLTELDIHFDRPQQSRQDDLYLHNTLFTFRRTVLDDQDTGSVSVRETTLQARRIICNDIPETEELMSDLVKRLQEMAKTKASSVLRFPKQDREAIKDGDKRVVFVLPQLNNAKFTKEEFGSMKTTEFLMLTRERPLLVDIETEDTGDGEALELF